MPETSRQLALDLPAPPRYGREDFLVTPSNSQAWEMFERWPEWPGRTLLLIGPPGSGKSHLGAIWARRAGARVIAAADLPRLDLPDIARSGAALLEDADRPPLREREMFHLINLIAADGGFLAITATTWPDAWGVGLPDLLSRLRRAPAVAIEQPDEALMRAVLVKLFVDRQLIVETSVIEYLVLRMERSLDAARSIVAALDRAALERGRAITRPLAAAILGDVADTDAELS